MTKIADSYFIDPDTGKKIPVRMEYTGVFKPDTTMITAHNVYRLNNGVAEKLDGSGWRQPNTDDPNYWKTNIRQAANNQEEPLNSVKYYWNKFTNWIKENKNGGNMNYASYLQGGGPAPLNAAPQVSKEDIAEIITAALLGTDEVKQQASEMLQSMLQDDSIAPLVLQVMEEMGVPMQKCGGRVKKKALGSKLIKTQKAKCGCELKKVGGRLIEVDSCTGLPVHRNGGTVRKYQNSAGGGITFKDGAFYNNGLKMSQLLGKKAAQANWGVTYNDGNYYYLNDGTLYTLAGGIGNQANSYGWKAMDWNKLDPTVAVSLGLRSSVDSKGNRSYYQQNDNGTYTRYGANAQGAGYAYGYGKGKDGKNYFYSNFGASDANWDPTKNTWTREGFNYDPNKGWSVVEPEQPVVENPKKDPAAPQAPSTGTPGLFTGDLRSYGARRQWVTDNADYLMQAHGWTLDRINGYKGSAADNLELSKQIAGRANWQPATPKETIAEVQNPYTNKLLLALSENDLARLSTDDAARRTRLLEYNNARNQALNFQGTLYANEDEYNAAVDNYNLSQAGSAYIQLLLANKQLAGRKEQSAGNNSRRQKTFDLMGKVMAGDTNYFDLSNKELRALKRMRNRDMRRGLYQDENSAKAFYTKASVTPQVIGQFNGNAALTEDQLNATSFKNGGTFTYADYLK